VYPLGTIKIYDVLVINRVQCHVTHVAVFVPQFFKFRFTFMSVEIKSFILFVIKDDYICNKFPADVYTAAMSENCSLWCKLSS